MYVRFWWKILSYQNRLSCVFSEHNYFFHSLSSDIKMPLSQRLFSFVMNSILKVFTPKQFQSKKYNNYITCQ